VIFGILTSTALTLLLIPLLLAGGGESEPRPHPAKQ